MIRDTSAQDQVLKPMRSTASRRLIGVIAAVLALGASATLLISNWRDNEHTVSAARLRIAEVKRGTLIRDAAVNGRLVAAVNPTLYASAPATVSLKVAAGDTVRKGQILAVLDSPDLTDALKREQATFQQLEAEVARQQILSRKQKLLAQREADTAEIDRLAAQRTLERYESVAQVGVIAKIDYQRAKDALRSSEIRAKHAASAAGLEADDVGLALRTKRSELERQRLSLANAQRRVDELTLRAPVDGLVGTLAVQNRSVVPANAPLMTLVDLSRLEVELEVPETFVADLGLGMTAMIDLGGGNPVTGKLVALSPEVVKSQVLARVRFDGAQPQGLRQNQRVAARLLIDERPNVVLVARGPFVEEEGGRFAYVVRDGVALRRPITLGATSVTAVEIRKGLLPGERVVIAGTDSFNHAARIAIHQ